MANNYNINITYRGKGTKQAFGGGNLTKMNKSNGSTSQMTSSNLRGFAGIGLSFRMAQMGNETLGAYTGDRLNQRKGQMALTLSKYAVGIATLGPIGAAYMASDITYRTIQYNIEVQKRTREAEYFKRLSGNNATSGSRYRGDYS
jgi:hypothetical protein